MRHMLSITALSFLLAVHGCGPQTVRDVAGSDDKSLAIREPEDPGHDATSQADTGRSLGQDKESVEKSKEFAGSKAGQEWDGNGLKMKFCWCPPGKFTMGSPKTEFARGDDEDQVEVTLTRGFWLGKHEVTQREWERIMATTLREQWDKTDKFFGVYGEGADYPIYYVNHDEATEFCRKFTDAERRAGKLLAAWEYGLPSEAQWEYACRAGTTTATAFGDKLGSDQANFDGSLPYNGAAKGKDLDRTAIVGSYKANAWGSYDMHGNVTEWCRDWFQETRPGGIDPEETRRALERVHRGGSWFMNGQSCRSTIRSGDSPNHRSRLVGFRVALVQSSK